MRPSSSFQEAGVHGGAARHPASADSTPLSASRSMQQQQQQQQSSAAAHQRASTTFSASSPHGTAHDLAHESEEAKKHRLEAAERSRLKKKNDAAQAAKASEDKLLLQMSSFNMH